MRAVGYLRDLPRLTLKDLEPEERTTGATRRRTGIDEARLRRVHDWRALSTEVRRTHLRQVVATAIVSDAKFHVELAH